MAIPHFILPMLASPGEFFHSPHHLYEPKWDGIRCMAYFQSDHVRLMSRNARDISAQFPELNTLLQSVPGSDLILDGELVVIDEHGKPSFDLVRNRNLLADVSKIRSAAQARPATYIVFDVIYQSGCDITALPLASRRKHLDIITPNAHIQISPALIGADYSFYQTAVQQGMEGVVIKELSSPYAPGQRTRHWVKVRHVSQADCVIGGYVPRSSTEFASLLLGQYKQADLTYVGHVGTGFTNAVNTVMTATLQRIVRPTSPFPHMPRIATKGAIWVEPVVVCVIEFLTWTSEGMLRHPVLRGIRTDKTPTECLVDQSVSVRRG